MKARARRLTGVLLGISLAAGLAGVGASTTAGATPTAVDGRQSVASAAARSVPASTTKTDRVTTPKLRWVKCFDAPRTFCATVKVPLDYDKPHGATIELAVLKVKARKPRQRIGSLFVNPGGPGGSAVDFASEASSFLSPRIRDRFDIIGMDPRGVGYSEQVRCFANQRQQDRALESYVAEGFPITAAQVTGHLNASRTFGRACSKAKGLALSMSTAEVARDMELLRRAVKDKKLTYLGFSYGTYLGAVYANLYPKRFRALAIDGVLNPQSWSASNTRLQRLPLELRINSGAGAWRAFQQILTRCDQVGATRCALATGGARVKAQRLADRLRATPLQIVEDGETYTYSYSDYASDLLSALYDPAGWEFVIDIVRSTYELAFPATSADARRADLVARHRAARAEAAAVGRAPAKGSAYDSSLDAFASVVCTDARERTSLRQYPAFGRQLDRSAPLFGQAWLWSTAPCAGDAFTGQDEDAYRGPFTRKTKATVLVVGDYFDPATNYADARSTATLLGRAKLLSSNSYGHTAYGTSACVTTAVDDYLVTGKTRRRYATCLGDDQPFTGTKADLAATHARARLLARVLRGPA